MSSSDLRGADIRDGTEAQDFFYDGADVGQGRFVGEGRTVAKGVKFFLCGGLDGGVGEEVEEAGVEC